MFVVFLMLIFSVSGENKHYGTPTNPAAHQRLPGGSSSGAAVAVAAKLVDFSLGKNFPDFTSFYSLIKITLLYGL